MIASEKTEKHCARCGANLYYAKLEGFALHGCGACGGVWLDDAAAASVMGGHVAPAASLASALGANTKPSLALLVRAPACPDCQKPLSHVTYSGASLDICAEHGAWFDRGELGQLMRAAAPPLQRACAITASPPPPAQGEYPWLHGYVLVSRILAALALVTGIVMVLFALGLFDERKHIDVVAVVLTLVSTTIGVVTLMALGDGAKALLHLSDRPIVR